MAVMEREAGTEKRLDDLNARVESIDRRMEAGFAEMRAEFRAVRTEMREEFQAVRAEMREECQAVRAEMREEFQAVRAEMREEFQAVRAETASMNRTLVQTMVGGFVAMGVGFAGTIATVILTQA